MNRSAEMSNTNLVMWVWNVRRRQNSVQFSCSVMSESLRPHGLQHARLAYPSPTPRVYSNSCPLSQWCHPTISTSVVPFFPPQVWGNWYSKRFTNQHYGTELLKTRARISSSLYIWFQIPFCPPRSGQRLEKVFE